MKNYIQAGHVLPVVASVDYASGDLVVEDAFVGVAQTTAIAGAMIEVKRIGVFDLKKVAGEAIEENAPVYATVDRELSGDAEVGVLVGMSVGASGADDTSVHALLDGVIREPLAAVAAEPE